MFRHLITFLALAITSPLFAKDPDIAAALKAKGAEITETTSVVTGVAFRDCSALGAGDYAQLRQLAQLKSLSFGKAFNDAAVKALGALPELEMLSTNGMDVSDDGVRALTACRKL